MEDKVDQLVELHFQIKDFLDGKNYQAVVDLIDRKMVIRDKNELKTISIIIRNYPNKKIQSKRMELLELMKELDIL